MDTVSWHFMIRIYRIMKVFVKICDFLAFFERFFYTDFIYRRDRSDRKDWVRFFNGPDGITGWTGFFLKASVCGLGFFVRILTLP